MSVAPGDAQQTLGKTVLEHQTSRHWHSSGFGWCSFCSWVSCGGRDGLLLVQNASGLREFQDVHILFWRFPT